MSPAGLTVRNEVARSLADTRFQARVLRSAQRREENTCKDNEDGDGESTIEKDGESIIEKDGEGAIEKQGELAIEEDKEPAIEKDQASRIEKVRLGVVGRGVSPAGLTVRNKLAPEGTKYLHMDAPRRSSCGVLAVDEFDEMSKQAHRDYLMQNKTKGKLCTYLSFP